MLSFSGSINQLVFGTADIEGKPIDRQEFIDLVFTAIEAGITVFDTASNYQDGRAHLWLAEALSTYSESIDPNFLLSDVVVITKVGQLTNSEWKRRFLQDEHAPYYDFSETFLERQLQEASEVFGNIGQLIVLLHNPEDDRRLHRLDAFARLAHMLEGRSRCGCIHGWGLSSWRGLYGHEGRPAVFQLSDLADGFGAGRFQFFRAIEIPFGLWNAEQALFPGQSVDSGNRYTDVFDAARQYSLSIYVNSCFLGGARLPQWSVDADERLLAPVDVLRICFEIVPDAKRVLGASRSETIKTSVKALLV